jgi:L-alanine-DL-glutamate epimerase-like enolase superfamily enzyme
MVRVGRVEAFAVRYPEPNNDGKIRALTLARLETDDGLVGWGEAITGGQETSLAVAFVIERRLAPLVVGRDPRDVLRLWTRLRDATYWDGNGGLVTFGISAIDMALWDIAGKAAGVPLYRLLGGKRRDRLPACASTIFATDDLERVGREFRGFVAGGYRYVKGGWGHDLSIAFGSDERRDRAIAHAVRDAIGPDVQMIVDVAALMGWDSGHAIRMCQMIDDDVGLFWFEDPLVEHDLDGYRRLRAAVDTRICTGEKE